MAGPNRRFDVAVAGAGPAGLACAILLANGGFSVVVAGPSPAKDARTVALMQPSVRLLRNLNLWPGPFSDTAQPLRKLTLVDDSGHYFAAPRLTFSADELGHDAFGWNIPLEKLRTILELEAERKGIAVHQGQVTNVDITDKGVGLQIADASRIEAIMVIAADGRDSIIRQAAGIASTQWSYDQTAVAGSFAHSIPHDDTSTEYLGANGPLTTVPLPGQRSSLVWMDCPERIDSLLRLSEKDFGGEIQAAIHGELGLISQSGPRSAFPMRGLIASAFGCKRVMLVGEAAHVIPPIGAQGLNLSLCDAATAAELIYEARQRREDIGSVETVRKYASLRRPDVMMRLAVIHGFNRSLLSDFLPANVMRSASLAIAGGLPPLRSFIMRQGLEPSFHVPIAMRD
jgi:2-octaprenyl-6-methoxyphenol hydroxylase